MRVAVVLLACLAAGISALSPRKVFEPRIVGGDPTTINEYPYGVSMLHSATQTEYQQSCGGSILNQRSVLTAAHCFWETGMIASRWRARVGSSYGNSGGTVHFSDRILNHPQYNPEIEDYDIAILRLTTFIQYIPNTVGPATIAGANYHVPDGTEVWAIGWGAVGNSGGLGSEQLRDVQLWSVNQEICRFRYSLFRLNVTESMICSGWLDEGFRDQCQGDSGGPLLHNKVVVGVCSWGGPCADPFLPGVNARVAPASNWIVSNA